MSTMELREELAAGTLSAAEARKAIAALPRHLSEIEASDLYSGLRAWAWKTLDQRRRDDELREWVDVIRRLRLRMGGKRGRDKQLDTLADLVAESIAVAARLPVADVLRKRHAREILLLLLRAADEPTPKKQIMETLKLNAANMSRVMNLLSAAGLIEVERRGRETHYRLSRLGSKEAVKLSPISEWETGTIEALRKLPLKEAEGSFLIFFDHLVEAFALSAKTHSPRHLWFFESNGFPSTHEQPNFLKSKALHIRSPETRLPKLIESSNPWDDNGVPIPSTLAVAGGRDAVRKALEGA